MTGHPVRVRWISSLRVQQQRRIQVAMPGAAPGVCHVCVFVDGVPHGECQVPRGRAQSGWWTWNASDERPLRVPTGAGDRIGLMIFVVR